MSEYRISRKTGNVFLVKDGKIYRVTDFGTPSEKKIYSNWNLYDYGKFLHQTVPYSIGKKFTGNI